MKIKTLSILFFFIILIIKSHAQQPSWVWVQTALTIGEERGRSIAKDNADNVYVIGSFNGTNITFGNFTLIDTSSKPSDASFLVKYDQTGNVIWAKVLQGEISLSNKSIVIDASCNIYIAGSLYSNTLAFDTLSIQKSSSTGINVCGFLLKCDSSGNALWGIPIGNSHFTLVKSICSDSYNNVLVTGDFADSIVLGNNVFVGFSGIFFAKFNSNGNVLLAKTALGSGPYLHLGEGSNGISTNDNGDIFITGGFGDSVFTFGTINIVNSAYLSIFIAKYDSLGNIVWAKSIGSNGTAYGNNVSADTYGNVYFLGRGSPASINFDNITLFNSGIFSIYIAKFNSLGNVTWAKNSVGTSDDWSEDLTSDNQYIYITGNFGSPTITFGNITLNNSTSWSDIFVVRYDSAGSALWGKSAIGNRNDVGKSIIAGLNNDIYVTGYFRSDSITFDSWSFVNSGTDDEFFIGKINETVGVNENENINEDQVRVVYNQVTSSYSLFFKNERNEKVILSLKDVTGSTIKQSFTRDNNFLIDNTNYTKGLYFYSLLFQNKTLTGKILLM